MNVDTLKKLGLDVKEGSRRKRGEEFYINCPFCIKHGKTPDTGYRLGFNIKKKIYHCYRCEQVGHLTDLKELAILGVYHEEVSYDEIRAKIEKPKPSLEPPDFDLEEMSYPFDEETPIAMKYLIDRGYSQEEIQRYKIRVGRSFMDAYGKPVTKWAGRIIFPFFYEEKCIYAVGRTYNGKEPKYLNMSAPKGLVVYGIEEVVGKMVILCEGIISAHAAQRLTGIPAIAVLGKDPLDTQLNRIRNKCEVVYQCWDGDVAPTKKFEIARRLTGIGLEVWDIEMPTYTNAAGKTVGHDPDSLKGEFVKYFEAAKRAPLF